MKKALPAVYAPVLLVYSKDDQIGKASESHAVSIYDALGCQDKWPVWIENRSHIITHDAAREQVFEVVRDFISTTSGDKR